MIYNKHHQAILTASISLLFVFIFVAWAELDISSLHKMAKEDGPIENISAILFGLSSICFIVVAYRSEFLRGKGGAAYFMTISWALLMFVFMGEEISWGQRIFDFSTPDALREINLQNETNIHNIEFVDTFMGGKYRYLTIMMLTTGLLLPLFVLSKFGKKTIHWFSFPVSPLRYAPLFVGAFIYGRYYAPLMIRDAAEVRKFLMSVGMFSFALHGALSPCTLFRACLPDDT